MLDARIHVFEMTDQVSEKGFYILRYHTLVRLVFHEVVKLRLDGVNHQNALFGLHIADISERQMERVKFEVKFAAAWGLDCEFKCGAIAVVSTEPFQTS